MNILGIDPGVGGGIALLSDGLDPMLSVIKDLTEKDISSLLRVFSMNPCVCYIEKVHAAPGQGVSSMFTFGQNYGFWRGLLTAYEIPFEEVSPQTWQGFIGFKSPRGTAYAARKRLLKQRAEQLYPKAQINLGTADALLIAEYGRRVYNLRNNKNPS